MARIVAARRSRSARVSGSTSKASHGDTGLVDGGTFVREVSLPRHHISVPTAEPFAVSMHAPHVLRLEPGSVELGALHHALATLRQVIGDHAH